MAYFINDTYLAEVTAVTTTLNAAAIKRALHEVDLLYVKPLLGIPLYDFFADRQVSGTPLQPSESELFAMVKYYMALKAEYTLMHNIVKLNGKGVTQDDKTAGADTIALLRQENEAKSKRVEKCIFQYLEANKTDFPQFFPEPKSTASADYTAGILFEDNPKIYFM